MDTAESTVPPPPPPPGSSDDPSVPSVPVAPVAPGVDAPPAAGAGGRRRWSRRRSGLVVFTTLVLVGLVVAGFLWQLPYYTLSPGSVRETASYISVQGAPSYPDQDGAIDYLTVSVRQGTPFDLLRGWVDPAVEVVPAEQVLGNQSPGENRQFNLQLMANSKDAATYQALRRMGYEIPSSGTGAAIAAVDPAVPAATVLSPGDVVVSADGQPVTLNQDLIRIVSGRPPGDVVQLGVQPFEGGDTTVVSATLVARADDPQRAMLGVTTFTRDLTFDFPVQVTIDSGSVGGPSAGLAFTLGILDALTPESLTGGRNVATTGTMELDGRVGPVGGVQQKVVAARRAGVELMMVPTIEIDEARRFAGGLRIEPVDDLDQALAVLATLGGGDAVLPPAPVAA